jgi:hypothetical protein
MRLTALLLVAGAMALSPAAQALPLPAGACSALDDGVASQPRKGPTPERMGVPAHAAENFQPPFQTAIVDLTFVVDEKGGVSGVDVLCATPQNPAFTAALVKAAADWRFAPAGKAQRLAYRIIVPNGSGPAAAVRRIFLSARPVA